MLYEFKDISKIGIKELESVVPKLQSNTLLELLAINKLLYERSGNNILDFIDYLTRACIKYELYEQCTILKDVKESAIKAINTTYDEYLKRNM